jgi:hypothetical protein
LGAPTIARTSGGRAGIGVRRWGNLLELRAALIDHEFVAWEIPGLAVKDQMEPLGQQVLEHLVELVL